MGRKPILNSEQKTIIEANLDLFPAAIKNMPEFKNCAAVSRDVIRRHQNKCKQNVLPSDKQALAALLQQHLQRYGLPSRFHGKNNVTGFLEYLEQPNKE